jgi:hypothetical protein
MVFRASRLGPRRLLTADAAAPPPSLRSRCWEGGGFGPCTDGAPARPRLEHWRDAEFSACAVAASSNAFSCLRTRRSSEVAASTQSRNSMAAAAKFCDACRKSGDASVLAFVPSLVHRLLSCATPRGGGIGARSCG